MQQLQADRKRARVATIAIAGDDCAAGVSSAWQQTLASLPPGKAYEDPEFPASQISIDGKEAPTAAAAAAPPVAPPVLKPGSTPRCRCGTEAAAAVVKSDTPNKGKRYFHCVDRKCGFFAWADGTGGPSTARPKEPLAWTRLPSLEVVSDFGFRAADLRQGGVGDCWFLSALAVVAERHDLIARLFEDTARNGAGCYGIRFFLDGVWTSVLIDDRLPVAGATARRPDLAFDAKLAFSRCGSATQQMLWASLLEKAYAKAHGSYQAISGGEISEALLDLTGAPTLSIDFDDPAFSSERLWHSMVEWKRLELPMGCATDRNPELREVGLCGGHAYSVLSVREVILRHGGGTERLVHVRNPHGVGEWNGDWSDRSAKWAAVLGMDTHGGDGGPERTGVDDGTFWIDWTHFLMGFALVEVCLARRGWHARSLPNAFPPKASAWRVCQTMYRLKAPPTKATLYLLALQPTKRGAWCRADRKKSYRPGDVSVVVVRLRRRDDASSDAPASTAAWSVESVVGGGLRGAESRPSSAYAVELEPGEHEYLILPLCLGQNPTAAETTAAQPFFVRLFSSEPLVATPEAFSDASATHREWALRAAHEAAGPVQAVRRLRC